MAKKIVNILKNLNLKAFNDKSPLYKNIFLNYKDRLYLLTRSFFIKICMRLKGLSLGVFSQFEYMWPNLNPI